MKFISVLLSFVLLSCTSQSVIKENNQQNLQTVGGGTINDPAKGPDPGYHYDEDTTGYILVKNWDFGLNGTIQNMEDMSKHFQYHDQFNTISNGVKYGAKIVSPDMGNALPNQPIENINTSKPVREFFEHSIKTYLVALDGATTVHPDSSKAGCGSFQAKWTLPSGGELLGMDMIWETRVRYNTPPYFWFAIWTAGNKWNRGAEMDVVESFGFDNNNGFTNFNGSYWHSSVVGGTMETHYHADWIAGMDKYGFKNFDATEYHTWTWVYRSDDTYTNYLDGKEVQNGKLHWTLGGKPDGENIDMSFIFDAGWGHTKVNSVNKPLTATAFIGKYYEWDYSRVYLRKSKKNN